MAPSSRSSRSRRDVFRFVVRYEAGSFRPRTSEGQRPSAPAAPRPEERSNGRRGGCNAASSGGHHSSGHSRKTPTPSATPERPISQGRPPLLMYLDPMPIFATHSAARYEATLLLEISDMVTSRRSRVYQELYTPVMPMTPWPSSQYLDHELSVLFYLPGGRYSLPVYSVSNGIELRGYVYQHHATPRAQMFPVGGQTGSQGYRYHWLQGPYGPSNGVPYGAPSQMCYGHQHHHYADEQYFAHRHVQQLILTPATITAMGTKDFCFS